MLFFSKKESLRSKSLNKKIDSGFNRKTNFYNPNLISKVGKRKSFGNNNFGKTNFSTENILRIVTFTSIVSISVLLGSTLLTNASSKTYAKASGINAPGEVSLITRFSENETVVPVQKSIDLKEIQSTTSTVASTSSPQTTSSVVGKVDKPDFYIVKAGDNLYNISNQFKVELQKILDLNSISDSTKIQVGQKLRLS